jgi:hypothetical protein
MMSLVEQCRSWGAEQWGDFDNPQFQELLGKQSSADREKIVKEKNLFQQRSRASTHSAVSEGEGPDPEVETERERQVAALKAEQAAYMEKQNPSFVMYHSFYESLDDLHGENFEAHMRALCERGLYKKNGDYKGSVKMFMTQAIPQLEANERKRLAAKINGMKGGAPPGNQNAQK